MAHCASSLRPRIRTQNRWVLTSDRVPERVRGRVLRGRIVFKKRVPGRWLEMRA